MAKRVVILRHAKATHEAGFRDIDRPLTKRGERDAAAVGRFLRHQDIAPDLVVCSSSRRTTQTWDAAAAAAGPPVAGADVRYDPAAYDAGADDLVEIVRDTPADIGTLLIIGHNPAVADLVAVLTGDAIEFPTSALAVIELPAGWQQVASGSGHLTLSWTPKGS
jgi:phosphohistidine phosphatase